MKRIIIVSLIVLVVILSAVGFYYVVNNRQDVDFKEGIITPKGISINGDEVITDEIVVRTLVMELEKGNLEKATKRDMTSIDQADIVFSIHVVYDENASESGLLKDIMVLQDGSFVASKKTNGRLHYAKGQFGKYTLDYFTGLDVIQ